MKFGKPDLLASRWGTSMASVVLLCVGVLAFRGELLGKASSDVHTAPVEETADSMAALPPVLPSSAIEEILRHPAKVKPLPPEYIDSETLWLARAIYSESKRPEEQELIGWVVRNRVETRYRGKRTYRDVVLDPYQFSAFNPNSRKQARYRKLDRHTPVPGWQRTLTLAYAVRNAEPAQRPFSPRTRHFYSERAMVNRTHPEWADGLQPVAPRRPHLLDAQRFRFFEGVM